MAYVVSAVTPASSACRVCGCAVYCTAAPLVTFATTYKDELDHLIDEMFLLSIHLGAVKCKYNPIRRRLLARGYTDDSLATFAALEDLLQV